MIDISWPGPHDQSHQEAFIAGIAYSREQLGLPAIPTNQYITRVEHIITSIADTSDREAVRLASVLILGLWTNINPKRPEGHEDCWLCDHPELP